MTRQFNLSTLFFVTFIYAAALALLAAWNAPILQQALTMGVLTVFVVADLGMIGVRQSESSSVVCSYYATAFAFGAVGCLVGVFFEPSPATVPATSIDLKSAFAPLVRTFAVLAMDLALFALFSSTAFAISLFSLRRSRIARWLLLVNSPGTAILVWFGVVACCGG